MLQRDVEVVNALGIHARPSSEIVKLAAKFSAHITLARDGMSVNGKSIMGVMMLAAECGSIVTVTADGSDEAKALDALATLIGSKFEEH
jgi:phosphocarrier protein HPr